MCRSSSGPPNGRDCQCLWREGDFNRHDGKVVKAAWSRQFSLLGDMQSPRWDLLTFTLKTKDSKSKECPWLLKQVKHIIL